MFKSKSFTIAFVIMSIIIVLLASFLIYLLRGGASNIVSQVTVTTAATTEATTESSSSEEATTQTTEETTAENSSYSVRALNSTEKHQFPVVGEEVKEEGVLKIVNESGTGTVLFHKNAVLNYASSPGNLQNTRGAFDIVSKIYVTDNGEIHMMYKTEDGYYVDSDAAYISYEPNVKGSVTIDEYRISTYGYNNSDGIIVSVFSDDGKHVAFSIADYEMETGFTTSVLDNVIAEYQKDGSAMFEYRGTDGKVHEGTIAFEKQSGTSRKVRISVESALNFDSGDRYEIVLHN